MKSVLIGLLLLTASQTNAWSQEDRVIRRETLQQVLVLPRPPVQTELLTMTGVHAYPQPSPPPGELVLFVPVKLERLAPAITHTRVACTAVRTPTYDNNPFVHVGHGRSDEMELVNGALSDSLYVAIIAFAGKDLSRALAYRCDLNLKVNGTWRLPTSIVETYPVDPAQPFKFAVLGTIPQS